MKSTDQIVKELTGQDSEAIKAQIPTLFYSRLVAVGRRRFGSAMPGSVVAQKAIVYAAALGLLAWEKEYKERKTTQQPSRLKPSNGKERSAEEVKRSAPARNRTWTRSFGGCCDIHFTTGAEYTLKNVSIGLRRQPST
jgi:hypothetical protein